ncbi:hypothetical protein PIB30_034515 [Stylosanthes scabra]|uniref:U-box domain-containing protein n=1 Tax=Stylosanthes scabra TaxID=79078 RepID=A0ABU6ZCB5_9FABA|nr:hypothetical protein [Stylosanthes scabra]
MNFSITVKAFSTPVLTQDNLNKLATNKVVEYVKSGMVFGLGTGSTVAFVVVKLGKRIYKIDLLRNLISFSQVLKIGIKALFTLCLVNQTRHKAVVAGALAVFINKLTDFEKRGFEKALVTVALLSEFWRGVRRSLNMR